MLQPSYIFCQLWFAINFLVLDTYRFIHFILAQISFEFTLLTMCQCPKGDLFVAAKKFASFMLIQKKTHKLHTCRVKKPKKNPKHIITEERTAESMFIF